MLGQEYLKFLKNFMSNLGFTARQLTEQEVETMEFYGSTGLSDEPIEGEYREIK
jgi:hypothetical protein